MRSLIFVSFQWEILAICGSIEIVSIACPTVDMGYNGVLMCICVKPNDRVSFPPLYIVNAVISLVESVSGLDLYSLLEEYVGGETWDTDTIYEQYSHSLSAIQYY